jgi:aspartate aminotransferase
MTTPPVPTPGATVAGLPRSGIRQIMELAMERGGTLNLSFGEPDFDTPAHIVAAADEAARAGRTRYTASRGIPELREAAAAAIKRRGGHPVMPDQIVATVGGVQGVFATLAATCDRGDRVLVPDPCWPNYVGICTLLGLEIVRYPLPAATGFEPDLDELEALAAAAGAKVLITNTPSNPTGAVWRRETVAGTVELAVRHGMFVLSDEVYDEMAFDGEHVPSAPYAPDHVVTVYSLSKTYAMTGWRIGYVAAPAGLVGSLGKVPEVEVSCPTAPAQWAAVAALTGPQDCVREMRDAYRLRRDLAVATLREEGVFSAEPRGAFYVFADISAATSDTFGFAEHLVREHGVAVAPGDTFGPGGAGLLRISLAAAPDTITEGIRRIGAAVRAGVPV